MMGTNTNTPAAKAAKKRYYQRNKALVKRRAVISKQKQRKINGVFLRELKEKTPCADCKLFYPACVMDFDHIRGMKKANVGKASYTYTWSIDKLKEEIAKCELVCSNCHRIRTHITRKKK